KKTLFHFGGFFILAYNNYLNVKLSELDKIPKIPDLAERLKYIEDIVYNQGSKYWLLETARYLNDLSYTDKYTRVGEVLMAGITGEDASQEQLINDLSVQYNFYLACRQRLPSFQKRISNIMNFISNCTEKIDYIFVSHLKKRFILSGLEPKDLEEVFKKICDVIPNEHAENFSMIYWSMLTSYFAKTKDYNMNRQFITKLILSRYSFILTGFKHKKRIYKEEAAYVPSAQDIYTAFADALHDPRLIDNIIIYNALEFTFRGISNYPAGALAAYQDLITNLTEKYYKELKKENNYGIYKDVFVNRHGADVRRFSYTVYKKILTEELGHNINSSEFNVPNSKENLLSLPSFIYDAILKVLLTMAPAPFDDAVEKIYELAVLNSNFYKCDKNYADFLSETIKTNSYVFSKVRLDIAGCLANYDIPSAIFLFKNLARSPFLEYGIDLFEAANKLPELIEGIKNFEFVNWENEISIYRLLKEHRPELVETLFKQMSMQPSCFFGVPSDDIDNYIKRYYNDIHNYKRLGSVAFVCRNEKLLESFRDDLDEILTNWDFVLNFHKFYNGVFSVNGIGLIYDLPFFRIYYAEMFQWLDRNISSDDKALSSAESLW
ncbi:hypothetical protein ENBRE01_3292, partial [Enteropsectra breve]